MKQKKQIYKYIVTLLIHLLIVGCISHNRTNKQNAILPEKIDNSGLNETVDAAVVAINFIGVTSNIIENVGFLEGSNRTILKVILIGQPCTFLYEKHNTSIGVLWTPYDVGCLKLIEENNEV